MSNEKCPFVVGSGYLTRDGRPALCIGMNPSGDPTNQVVFSVGVPGDSYVYATRTDGTFLRDSTESVYDILPPEPKLVERWVAIYVATESGVHYATAATTTFDSKEDAEHDHPSAHSYLKIMVPE